MMRISKRVEYALLATQYMAANKDRVVPARDIASRNSISVALLSKVLQQLVQTSIIQSFQGIHGGYTLARPATDITILDIIHAVEGTESGLVQCQEKNAVCCSSDACTIREPLQLLNSRIQLVLAATTVEDLLQNEINQYTILEKY